METVITTSTTETEVKVLASYVKGTYEISTKAGDELSSPRQDKDLELAIHNNDEGKFSMNLDRTTFTWLGGIWNESEMTNFSLIAHHRFTLGELEMLHETLGKFISAVKNDEFTE
jgi:hypothetical protein